MACDNLQFQRVQGIEEGDDHGETNRASWMRTKNHKGPITTAIERMMMSQMEDLVAVAMEAEATIMVAMEAIDIIAISDLTWLKLGAGIRWVADLTF